ncbi:MAG TPA: TrbI/VirB10 family protein [Caulobacteraceae bacterium]
MVKRPLPDSPVFREPRPRVTQSDSPWSMALGIAVAVVLGVIVFASLSNGRQARAEDAFAPAEPAVAPAPMPNPAPPAKVTVVPAPPPAPMLKPAAQDPGLRWRSPALVVDLTTPAQAARPTVLAQNDAEAPPQPRLSAEEAFASRVTSSGPETAYASRLRDTARIAPQGTMIPAVLETAINSDLPGSVRAVVSQDVRGFDGSTVLIPRGSKLIGQYRSGVALGQSRAFVVWSRILTPEGVSIDSGSPGTDPLGRGGLEGETDTHFFQRFGGAILLSVMSAGVQAASHSGGDTTAIIIGSPEQAGRLAELAPKSNDIPVTVKVMQGTPLQVFVTRDLDFSGVAP